MNVRSDVLIEYQKELYAGESCFPLYWQSKLMGKYSKVTDFGAKTLLLMYQTSTGNATARIDIFYHVFK